MSRKAPIGALSAVMFLLLASGACGSDGAGGPEPADSPQAAVERLVDALEAGDCPEVQSLVLDVAAMDCDTVAQTKGSFADEGIDVDSVRYSAGDVTGTSSQVIVDWGNGSQESFDVERVDGRWKVNFESAA